MSNISSSTYSAPSLCTPAWSINASNSGCNADNNMAQQYAAEQLAIAGANVNVFQLLGVSNQGKLQDLTGAGTAISSSTAVGFIAANAFVQGSSGWESADQGPNVVSNAWLGYNFGTKKSATGADVSDPTLQPTKILESITTIVIQQGSNLSNQVSQAKIESSNDGGQTWTRVDIISIPISTEPQTISIKYSAPAQIWRIVPLIFNGGATDPWVVLSLQMMNYTQTSLTNVEDYILLENRDRSYATASIQLLAYYDLIEISTELTKFGIDIPSQYIFTFSFAQMINSLGRPIVVGDILEIPSEGQYDQNLKLVRKYLEVTDASWSQQGYTPGWLPIMFRVTAQPALASQENINLFKSDQGYNSMSDQDFNIDNSPLNLLTQDTTAEIVAESEELTPYTGSDVSSIQSGMSDLFGGVKGSYDGRDIGVEDGMPPDNASYTEGPTFPTSPVDQAYHRMTYPNTNIPVRLYQFSLLKNRWIYLETDRRRTPSSMKPSIQRLINGTGRINITDAP